MLSHDFIDMPGRSMEIGDNPHETVMLLRCRWCHKTPTKAREDGCVTRELEERGYIVLSQFNPAGVEYFNGRACVTCHAPIMDHHLMKGSQDYWCVGAMMGHICEGISDCVYDVGGVTAPREPDSPQCQPQ